MRILWASNAPWHGSGYGVQTAQVVRRLRAAGHDVAIAANFGLNGAALEWSGIPIFPNGLDGYGNDAVPYCYARWREMGGGAPTLLLTLFDVWVYRNAEFDQLPIASWTPVDHAPVPPQVGAWARKHETIAMSKFGRDTFAEAGIKAHYVPHAFEGSQFHPSPSNVRATLGVPESAFLVMINAANKGNMPPRKGWHEMLTAFAMLANARPDAYLYLHTDLEGHNGVALRVLLESLGLTPDRVKVAPQVPYRLGEITQAMLANLYSAADVLLLTSYGEGFGIPAIEAAACGLPVIVSDFSAQSELAGPGWKVGTQPYWDLTQGAWFGQPLIAQIVAALDEAYRAKGDQGLRDRAVEFAQQYEADRVYAEHWVPTLEALERTLLTTKKIGRTNPAGNRAARRQGKRRAA